MNPKYLYENNVDSINNQSLSWNFQMHLWKLFWFLIIIKFICVLEICIIKLTRKENLQKYYQLWCFDGLYSLRWQVKEGGRDFPIILWKLFSIIGKPKIKETVTFFVEKYQKGVTDAYGVRMWFMLAEYSVAKAISYELKKKFKYLCF